MHPYGVHIISFLRGRTSTRLRLVPGSYAHPMGVHMGAPSGHPLQHVQKVHPLGDNPFGVNFGQNYRDLGHFVRVTFFWPKLPAPLRGTSMGTPQGYPYVGTLSGTHISGQFLFFLRGRTMCSHFNGHPTGVPICGHPIGYPHFGPIFIFVKLLPLRGRHVCMW